MKVLFISAGDYKYGAPKSMFELMIELQKYGVEPYLLTKKRNMLNEKCSELGIVNDSCWYADIMAGAPYSNPLLKILKHVVKYFLFLIGHCTKEKISNIPLDEIDLIHTNLNRIDIGAKLSKKYNIPHVWHLRELGEEDYNLVYYKKNCIDYMNKNADAFIAISQIVKNTWIKKGIDSTKIHVIYNGLNLDDFQPSVNREDSFLKIVMTGHIQPNKGQLQLIEAIQYLPDNLKKNIIVDIYGEAYADYLKVLQKKIKEIGCENINFKGYSQDIPNILKNYDIGIVASKAEGFGRITVEYMASKLLVIATDTGANPEIVDDQITGLIYTYGNSKQLAEKIVWAYDNHDKMKIIAENGYHKAHSKYSCSTGYAEQVYKIYESVINKQN